MKSSWKSLLLVGVFIGNLSLFAADSIKIDTPADGAVVTMFHPVQEMLVRSDLESWKKCSAAPAVTRYWAQSVKSFPAGVRIDWSMKSDDLAHRHYRLEWGRDPQLADAQKIRPPHSEYTLYNLLLGETYYYRVIFLDNHEKVTAQTPIQKFTVELLPPRVMNVPGVDNVRDLGGYPALDGRRVKQGMIYRSSGLNANSSDRGKTPGKARFTEEGKCVLLEELKIKTELDLRWPEEIAGMTTSPLGKSVRYVSNPSTLYAGAFTAEGKAIYAKSFRLFTNPANYPIDFHCIVGADRTGTLAYLLGAVLGVPEELLQKDYVFTSFYTTRNFASAEVIANELKKCGEPGDSVLMQAERYWLSCGVTPAEIQQFRDVMLGEGTKPDGVLQSAQRKLDFYAALNAKYTQTPANAKLVPFKVFHRTGEIAGKSLQADLPLPPSAYRADWKLAADGGWVWLLSNPDVRPLFLAIVGKFPGDAAKEWYLAERFSGVWYRSPSGKAAWTAAELANLKFYLPPQTERVLTAIPADAMEAPQALTAYPAITERDAMVRVVTVTVLPQAPALNLDEPDALWAKVPVQSCVSSVGKPLANAPTVQLATNPEHSELYLKAAIPDATPVAKLTGAQVKVWGEDSVEFFIAESGDDSTLQVVFGRSGGTYVEWYGSWKSRPAKLPEGTRFAVREVPGGWELEAVVKLDKLNLATLPRLNVCGGDRPSETLFNLLPTEANFHDANLMGVVQFQ